MSSTMTNLERKPSIRTPLATNQAPVNNGIKPLQPIRKSSTLQVDVEYISTAELFLNNNNNSSSSSSKVSSSNNSYPDSNHTRLQEQEKEKKQEESDVQLRLRRQERLRVQLLDDHFARDYIPTYEISAPLLPLNNTLSPIPLPSTLTNRPRYPPRPQSSPSLTIAKDSIEPSTSPALPPTTSQRPLHINTNIHPHQYHHQQQYQQQQQQQQHQLNGPSPQQQHHLHMQRQQQLQQQTFSQQGSTSFDGSNNTSPLVPATADLHSLRTDSRSISSGGCMELVEDMMKSMATSENDGHSEVLDFLEQSDSIDILSNDETDDEDNPLSRHEPTLQHKQPLQRQQQQQQHYQQQHYQQQQQYQQQQLLIQQQKQQQQQNYSPLQRSSATSPRLPASPKPTSNHSPGSSISNIRDPADPMIHSEDPNRQCVPEMETSETLKRERTRILARPTVINYRRINYSDITNITPLKKGGFGEIHVAEWSRLKVVLKRALVDHGEGEEQFAQELEILTRVHDYDFIVPFYGVATDPVTRVKCIVMKHCSNGNLCSFLEKNHSTLSWNERYRLSIEITKGLEFLHKSGFHHRDLHSGNILLDDKRTAMICDFGLSRSSTKAQTADIVAAVGVASFLAPERFPAKRPIYTAACDIYSLGVIFWHISSGRIPFAKRLREAQLLKELMEGHREQIVPGTPKEYRDMLVKCWDVNPAKRLKIDVVIAILQTLMAKPTEPVHQMATGFMVPSLTKSAALPVPPELSTKMSSLERASNILNKMVFDIKDPEMKETVKYINETRKYFANQRMPMEPYSAANPPKTPIYLCPLVGDISALSYYLSHRGSYNPINESSSQTGDTALHLACLFLESPLDTIKVLVELGADINLENLQGYTPVMILVSSNTQYCFEALKYFVMRGAMIPAYIRHPITPLNSAQTYALNLISESRLNQRHGTFPPPTASGRPSNKGNNPLWNSQQHPIVPSRPSLQQTPPGSRVDRPYSQGRPLIHVVAAMQEDHRILDCLYEAGLDPAISFSSGDTALVAAAAHLRIKNVEWLLNNDLDISANDSNIQRAIRAVKLIHGPAPLSTGELPSSIHSPYVHNSKTSAAEMKQYLDELRDLGKYSWAGVAYKFSDSAGKDMIGPVLQLLEQWTGGRRIQARKEVATKLKLMYGHESSDISDGYSGRTSSTSLGSSQNSESSGEGIGYYPPMQTAQQQQHQRQNYQQQYPQQQQQQQQNGPSQSRAVLNSRMKSLRKSQRHLIDEALNEKTSMRFW